MMAASKRDFVNFNDFPGEINSGTGIYEFPPLKYTDDANRLRKWQIYVRLVKDTNRQNGIDWNLLAEKQVPIKPEYFNSGEDRVSIPNGIIAESWVETGIISGKITRSVPTYIDKPAFVGQANERNEFQQALIYARSLYLKYQEKKGTTGTKEKKVSGPNVMYFPMLASTWKDGHKHIQYPLYVQPKLDGVRCIVYLKQKDAGADGVVVYSRTQKEFPKYDYLKNTLYPYLNDLYDEDNNQSLYLDGELYKHGKKLQDISGESRNEKKRDDTEDNLNEYHIYDCFYPLELDTPYSTRHEQLVELFRAIRDAGDRTAEKYIKLVPTFKVSTETAVQNKFIQFIKDGYEGAILRNITGTYRANATKTGAFMRSPDLIKLKKKATEEFEVVGYTEGSKGKDKGAVIWIAKTASGHKFNVTPKDMTYEERYNVYKECQKKFDKKYKGRMLTIEYEDLSKMGVPQRAKALIFRDYE